MDPRLRRHRVFVELWNRLQLLPDSTRRAVLNTLWAIVGRSRVTRPSHRTLSTLQVHELTNGGLIDIGAHTVTHSRLSALQEAEQRNELAASRRSLESLLGVPVKMMSYPFGGKADYTPLTVSLVREVGFSCALGATSGPLRAGPDLFQLPRCFVPDVGGDRFEKMLDGWLAKV